MKVTTATAPGKLFLLGEYAVLEGGPAILTPVPQRASVTLKPTGGNVTIIADQSHTLPLTRAIDAFPLLNSLVSLNPDIDFHQVTLTLDTEAFFHHGQKLGLGSSAALTVACVSALQPALAPIALAAEADKCHRHFQGGVGSGADIALSAMAQPIMFTMGAAPTPVSLPSTLHMLAIWTGTPASTTDLVNRVYRWRDSMPDTYAQHIHALKETAKQAIQRLTDGDTVQLLTEISRYDQRLEQMSTDSGVNFYTSTHLEMRKKVESARCVYKPSGAGGGDFGIAYSTDATDLMTLAENLRGERIHNFVLPT